MSATRFELRRSRFTVTASSFRRRRTFAVAVAAWMALACARDVAAQSPSVGLSSVRAQRFGRLDLPNANAAGEDRFGAAFAVGDFDGDGASDLATGVPRSDGATATPVDACGQVVVRYGIAGAGLDEATAPVVLGQFLGGFPEAGDRFGWALAACDLNADGFDDLAVGAPYEDLPFGIDLELVDMGVVEIYHGANGGLAPPASAVFPGGSGFPAGALFGYALACGDFDGDGFDDLVVGMPGRVVNGLASAGQIRVFPGSPSGIGSGTYAINQDSVGMADVAEATDYFGNALAAGDFDGDGFADLAIAVPGENDPSPGDRGAVQILYGSEEGLTADRDQTFYNPETSNGGLNFGFGESLAAGSFDGDPYDELAIGSPIDDTDSVDSGSVFVLPSSAAGLTVSSWERLSTNRIFPGSLSSAGDWFGSSLAAGDFDGDGADDLATGSPLEDVLGIDDGKVTVLMGAVGIGFVPGTNRARELEHGREGIPGTASEEGLTFGAALVVGDFDGDGISDLAIGAPNEGESLLPHVGTATVLYGALFADGFESSTADLWSAVAP